MCLDSGFALSARPGMTQKRSSGTFLEGDLFQAVSLAGGYVFDREGFDGFVEQAVEIDFRGEVEKDRAKPNGSPVHEDEFARYRHRTLRLKRLMHAKGFPAAVFGRFHAIGDGSHPVVEQRAVNETCPDIQGIDQLAVEPLEPPGLVSVHYELVIAAQQSAIEVDHTADKAWRENANTAVIQKIDSPRFPFRVVEDGVIAEMRVAMNDAEAAEGKPPRGEHRRGETIAHSERVALMLEQLAAGKPIQREQAAGRQIVPDFWNPDRMFVLQHVAIQFHVLRLSAVVELLAQTCADLDCDFAGVDSRIKAFADRKKQLQLIEVGFDRRLHVRILQLACNLTAIECACAVHLAE